MKRNHWLFLLLTVMIGFFLYYSSYREGFSGKNPLPIDLDLEKIGARPIENWRGAGKQPDKPLTPTVKKILDYAKTLKWNTENPRYKDHPEESVYEILTPEYSGVFKELRVLVSGYKIKPSYEHFREDLPSILSKSMPGFNEKFFMEAAKEPETGLVGRSLPDAIRAAYNYIFEEGFSPSFNVNIPPTTKKTESKCSPDFVPISGGTIETKCFS